MRKSILALLSFFVLTETVLLLVVSPLPQSADEAYPDSQETMQVDVTNSGFSPSSIGIVRGTRVRWTSRGERSHWPASDGHPTHTFYPSETRGCIGSTLDACRGLAAEETYEFVFDKTGQWGMHDHLFPGHLMTVEVAATANAASIPHTLRELAKSLRAKLAPAEKENLLSPEEFRRAPYGEQKGTMARLAAEEPERAWAYLKAAYLANGVVVGNPHELAHLAGNALYRRRGLAGIARCDNVFAYGCEHGVTEAMLLKEGRDRVPAIEAECLKFFPPASTQNYTGCIHGVGHGLLTWEWLDLKPALGDCDLLQEPYRPYCYDGVFMEYGESAPTLITLDASHPWQLCEALPLQYQYNCARYEVDLLLERFGGSFAETARVCRTASRDVLATTCLTSLGYHAAQTAEGDFPKILSQCRTIDFTEGQHSCLAGAAQEVKFQRYSRWQDVSTQLCDALPEVMREPCHRGVADVKE